MVGEITDFHLKMENQNKVKFREKLNLEKKIPKRKVKFPQNV